MSSHLFSTVPPAQGLYDPANESDSCGVAMVATLNKKATHEIVSQALTALRNLEHRGASGAEPDSGDGAGILIRIPDAFYRAVLSFDIPDASKYATGIAFISDDFADMDSVAKIADEEGLTVLGWRDVPVNSSSLGKTAVSVMPKFVQLFLAGKNGESDLNLDRLAFCFRKRVEHAYPIYFPSLSTRTIVYKACSPLDNLKSFSQISLMNALHHH